MATLKISLTFSGNLPKVLACVGESIHEIKWSWDGPEELKHANYVLWFPTQRVKVPKGGVCQLIPKSHGSKGDP